jgi:nitrogen fixation NifU-like protein
MSDLADLYQQVIVDHNRTPRNFKVVDPATATVEGDNPLCGDRISLTLRREGDVIADIGFVTPMGRGCAISKASASLMTSAVKGKTVAEADRLFQAFHAMLTSDASTPDDAKALGKLAAFQGVKQYPSRVKCASLAWHTLHAALAGAAEAVTTE